MKKYLTRTEQMKQMLEEIIEDHSHKISEDIKDYLLEILELDWVDFHINERSRWIGLMFGVLWSAKILSLDDCKKIVAKANTAIEFP